MRIFSCLVILALYCISSANCKIRPMPSRCLAAKPRLSKVCPLVNVERIIFYFNEISQKCVELNIGTCYAEGDNFFKTYDDCQRTCMENTMACCLCCCEEEEMTNIRV